MPLRRSWAGLAPYLFLLALALLLPAAATAAATGSCSALPEWFAGIPDVPTATPASSCQFQQFAWQTFLALLTTSPSQPVPRYLTWDFPKAEMNKLFCASACQGGTPAAAFNQCGGPSTEEVVNATTQPGFVPAGTSGEVIDQAGNPVYFTAHVSPLWLSFVSAHGLGDPNVLGAADSRLAFPGGTFEIKTSWRLAEGLTKAERAQYYVTRACVIPEQKETKPFEADLALVGFHVTGGADNHPELIWATFEHVDNAPDCDETPQPGPWGLYDGLADCRRQPSLCNRPNPSVTPYKPGPPINVCRTVPHGGADVDTARQIDHLNRDVQALLPRRSPLRFYELVGTLWAANSSLAAAPTMNLQQPAGSPLLSNTTLETFKQGVSCFGCHSSQFPGEFAQIAQQPPSLAGQPSVALVDKNLYASHVVLFPYFFSAAHNCVCPGGAARRR
jgi:hypothetical protein